MFKVIVKEKREEAESIVSFKLSPVENIELADSTPGAHIDIHLPSGLVRQYSIVKHSKSENYYQIAVLEEINSRGGSIELNQKVSQGDEITISEPRNLFELTKNAKRYLLFAGGIGITPILPMAEYLDSIGADYTLHYSCSTKEKTAFFDYINSSSIIKKTTFYLSNGDESKRVNADALLKTANKDTHIYTCGSNRYIDYILDTAKLNHWHDNNVHREFFSAAAIDDSADKPFDVLLNNSGSIFQIPADQSVFEVLDDAGIELAVSCEQGVCGSCVTTVLSGDIDHRDQFLTDPEKAKNNQFTPCCSRAKGSRLVLDM